MPGARPLGGEHRPSAASTSLERHGRRQVDVSTTTTGGWRTSTTRSGAAAPRRTCWRSGDDGGLTSRHVPAEVTDGERDRVGGGGVDDVERAPG